MFPRNSRERLEGEDQRERGKPVIIKTRGDEEGDFQFKKTAWIRGHQNESIIYFIVKRNLTTFWEREANLKRTNFNFIRREVIARQVQRGEY